MPPGQLFLQLADQDGRVVAYAAGGRAEVELIEACVTAIATHRAAFVEECVSAIVPRVAGVWRTEAQVRTAVRDGIADVARTDTSVRDGVTDVIRTLKESSRLTV